MFGTVDYLILTIVHRTNEDWYLELPIEINDLEGATARCQLMSPGRRPIVFNLEISNNQIIMRAESEEFAGKVGKYTGDVLLTLSGGRDLVTHVINLELKNGVTGHA